MKTKYFAIALLLILSVTSLSAQRRSFSEGYGNTLNLGLGISGYSGYYGYYAHSLPVLHINYEFDVAQNFTLAPFATFYSYTDNNYRETVIPVGVKGTLYFDRLLRAGSKWDFYGAASLGVALISTTWDADYYGDRNYYHSTSPLFLDLHLGTEYHITRKLGLFLDLSTAVSTVGIAIH